MLLQPFRLTIELIPGFVYRDPGVQQRGARWGADPLPFIRDQDGTGEQLDGFGGENVPQEPLLRGSVGYSVAAGPLGELHVPRLV